MNAQTQLQKFLKSPSSFQTLPGHRYHPTEHPGPQASTTLPPVSFLLSPRALSLCPSAGSCSAPRPWPPAGCPDILLQAPLPAPLIHRGFITHHRTCKLVTVPDPCPAPPSEMQSGSCCARPRPPATEHPTASSAPPHPSLCDLLHSWE